MTEGSSDANSQVTALALKAVDQITAFTLEFARSTANLINGANVASYLNALRRAKAFTGIGTAADVGIDELSSSLGGHRHNGTANRNVVISAGADIADARLKDALVQGSNELIQEAGSYSAAVAGIGSLTTTVVDILNKADIAVDQNAVADFQKGISAGLTVNDSYDQFLSNTVKINGIAGLLKTGTPISTTYTVENLPNGAHLITGDRSFIGLMSLHDDYFEANGHNNTFVFSKGCGFEEISDFVLRGEDRDKIDLSSFSEINSLGDVLSRSHDSDLGVLIALAPHAEVTLDGITKAGLRNHPHTFFFGSRPEA